MHYEMHAMAELRFSMSKIKKSVCIALYYKINNTIRVLVLSLMTEPNLKLLSTHSIMLNKFHTQLPLKRHMNGGEDIHIDSYKESHLDSPHGDLVSDNVTKVIPIAPLSSHSWSHLYSLYSI